MSIDATELAKLVPLSKKATPLQILGLLTAMGLLIAAGWWSSSAVKKYFDDYHKALIAEIESVGKPLGDQMKLMQSTLAEHDQAISVLRTYKVSNSDMQLWTRQLDKQNREAGKALSVPDFPEPSKVQ